MATFHSALLMRSIVFRWHSHQKKTQCLVQQQTTSSSSVCWQVLRGHVWQARPTDSSLFFKTGLPPFTPLGSRVDGASLLSLSGVSTKKIQGKGGKQVPLILLCVRNSRVFPEACCKLQSQDFIRRTTRGKSGGVLAQRGKTLNVHSDVWDSRSAHKLGCRDGCE